MTVHSTHDVKLFTVDQANAALPLVRAITRDVVELTRAMIERRERLHYIKTSRGKQARDVYRDELDDIEHHLASDASRLQELVDELTDLGVELKSLPEGLIDFPSLRDGRLVYLCWKYGEDQIAFWHDVNAGFAGRQAIDKRCDSAPDRSLESDPELN